jgi:hypothetical protein
MQHSAPKTVNFWLGTTKHLLLLALLLISSHSIQFAEAAPFALQSQCPPPPTGSSQPLVAGTNPDPYYTMRLTFTNAGRNALGSSGPTYDSINRGIPPSADMIMLRMA